MDVQAEFAAKIEAMRLNYVSTLEERAGRLRKVAAALRSGGKTEQMMTDVRFDVHKIAGTAGTFGYQSLGDTARQAESAIDNDTDDRDERILACMAELEAILTPAG